LSEAFLAVFGAGVLGVLFWSGLGIGKTWVELSGMELACIAGGASLALVDVRRRRRRFLLQDREEVVFSNVVERQVRSIVAVK
jgi:hypothetical protein